MAEPRPYTVASEPITVTIRQFGVLSGLSRTTINKMMNSGQLDRVKIGRRTLIVVDSYRQLLNSQLTENLQQVARGGSPLSAISSVKKVGAIVGR